MRHQDWYVHILENVSGDTAENDFAETRMTVRAHNQEIGIELGCLGQDRVGDC